jgi:hypothetical protein
MKGTLILYLGANKMPSSIDQGSALFQNIPSSWRNKEVHYSLISDEFIPAPGEKGTVRLAPETVFFQVAQKPLYIPFSPGSLHFDWDSADSYGVVRGLGGGKVIDLQLIVTLEGKGSLPLRAEAKAEFWNPSMSHLILVKEAGISTEESDELVVLQPNHPTFIHCNIPLTSKDAYFL